LGTLDDDVQIPLTAVMAGNFSGSGSSENVSKMNLEAK
jgi:hypothetical protein